MLPETVRLSQQSKEQLLRLKRRTGIQNWNVLSRWGLCLSLSDPRPPTVGGEREESNVEMSWRTFAGTEADVYSALVVHRAHVDSMSPSEALRAHLQRGIARLSEATDLESLLDFAGSEPAEV